MLNDKDNYISQINSIDIYKLPDSMTSEISQINSMDKSTLPDTMPNYISQINSLDRYRYPCEADREAVREHYYKGMESYKVEQEAPEKPCK